MNTAGRVFEEILDDGLITLELNACDWLKSHKQPPASNRQAPKSYQNKNGINVSIPVIGFKG